MAKKAAKKTAKKAVKKATPAKGAEKPTKVAVAIPKAKEKAAPETEQAKRPQASSTGDDLVGEPSAFVDLGINRKFLPEELRAVAAWVGVEPGKLTWEQLTEFVEHALDDAIADAEASLAVETPAVSKPPFKPAAKKPAA